MGGFNAYFGQWTCFGTNYFASTSTVNTTSSCILGSNCFASPSAVPATSQSKLEILREQLLFLPEYFHLRCILLDFENEKEPSTPPLDVSPAGHQINPR